MSSDATRRTFLGTASAVATAGTGTAWAQAPAKPGAYAIKPLGLDPQKIPGMSEKILVSHYENNYSGAVRRLNTITEQLAALDFEKAPVFQVNGLKREELMATNSMILHELFFASLAPTNQPDAALTQAIAKDFGSFEKWRSEFAGTGKALGGGSGWALLVYSNRDGRLVNQWAGDHTMTVAGSTPLLALDMYEHAYHMDYGARAAAYVDAFMNAINWANVKKLYDAASRNRA